MRKNKFKNYLKLGILLFGVSIFLVNCQKDDDFTQTTKQELLTKSKIPFEFKKKSYAQLNNDVKFVKAINNVFNKGKTNSRVNAKTVMEDQYGFTIDSTLIKEISSDDFTSYTFLIHREVVNESIFENLIVTINNDSVPKAYIIKYHLNSNPIYISEDDAYAIDSHTELTEIDYNNSQLKVSYTDSDGCTIVTIMCPYGGSSHPAGQACFDADRGDLFFNYDSSNCGDPFGGGGGGGGFGNGGTSSGGGGGSGSSSGGSGDNGGLGTSCRGCGDTGGPILTDPIWIEEIEEPCEEMTDEDFNNYYSLNSPFNVDLSEVRNSCDNIDTTEVAENEQFMCIYNKLTQSPKFKDLFLDTFGESEDLNVKFTIEDNIPHANGNCQVISGSVNPATGEVIGLELEIKIDKSYMEASSAIAVAKTIMHESIHAYLMLKYYGCNQGAQLGIMDDVDLSELLHEYHLECAPQQGQHEFMFNFLVPTLANILEDIKDELIPQSHQDAVAGDLFYNEENPTVGPLGEYIKDKVWDWNEFYKYLSLAGLHESSAFHLAYPDNPPSLGYQNFISYSNTGINSFRNECSN